MRCSSPPSAWATEACRTARRSPSKRWCSVNTPWGVAQPNQTVPTGLSALRAQATSDAHRDRIYGAIRHRLRHAPMSFVLPPRAETEPPPDASDDGVGGDGADPDASRD